MSSLLGTIAQRLGVKGVLVKYYEKLYDQIRTIQMYVLTPFDTAWNARNKLNVMSIEETIEYVIHNKCSISRFGDGELNIVSGKGIGFQSQSDKLTLALKAILHETKCVGGYFLLGSTSRSVT